MVKNLHFLKFIVFTVFFAVVTSANSPTIDGVINEGEWNDAIEYELEFEVSPGRNAPALLKTFAQIKHDDENLYVAFRAFADKDEIRATIRSRDTGWLEDYVGVVIDTFGDDRYAIALGVNALGSQLDLKQTPDDRDEDTSWNILFFAYIHSPYYGTHDALILYFLQTSEIGKIVVKLHHIFRLKNVCSQDYIKLQIFLVLKK